MERETFPKLKPQAPETQVCVLYHWESVVVVAIESMPFLFIRIHMTSMQTVSAEVSISEYPAFFKRKRISEVLQIFTANGTVCLNSASCLLLHYWYSLSEQCFLFTATVRTMTTL